MPYRMIAVLMLAAGCAGFTPPPLATRSRPAASSSVLDIAPQLLTIPVVVDGLATTLEVGTDEEPAAAAAAFLSQHGWAEAKTRTQRSQRRLLTERARCLLVYADTRATTS
jgi:hypothetical protein